MSGGIILIVIIAFIGNRIFGLYKDETTTRILEESGAIRPKKTSSRAGRDVSPDQKRRGGAKLTPYQIQFQKDRAILKKMASTPYGRKLLRQYRLEV